jgi:uncharacterized protein (DUF2267 family)
LRYQRGRWQGVRYRLAGGGPNPNVADDVLADRIRSTLGPLERRLDVPRIHVTVEEHVALLHGEVGTTDDAHQLERAVEAVAGVRGIESYLHVGLLRSDVRPSAGQGLGSDARRHLMDAATKAGVAEEHAATVAGAILSPFCERLPRRQRGQVLAHLPADVRSMMPAPRRRDHPGQVRSLPDLVAVAIRRTEPGVLSPFGAREVVKSVLAELHRLVPDDAADVSAVLPAGLRSAWDSVPTG